jgi:hypothetical protein
MLSTQEIIMRAQMIHMADTDRSPSPNARWIALAVVCLGQLMSIMDGTIVTVVLPAIQRDLHFTAGVGASMSRARRAPPRRRARRAGLTATRRPSPTGW